MHDVGVFYHCYKENDAVEFSVKSFKNLYPDSPMYIVSDNGNDFSYLEKKYKNIKFIKKNNEVQSLVKFVDNLIAANNVDIDLFTDIAIEVLNRIKNAIDYCQSKYIILMEPDVYVRSKFSLPKTDMVGPIPNEMPINVQEYIISKGGINNKYWGPAGGIMNTQAFLDIYSKIDKTIISEILLQDPRIVCYDYLLPVLFSIYGYRYENNPEQTECLRNPNWEISDHKILHQYRKYFDGNYDGKHKE